MRIVFEHSLRKIIEAVAGGIWIMREWSPTEMRDIHPQFLVPVKGHRSAIREFSEMRREILYKEEEI